MRGGSTELSVAAFQQSDEHRPKRPVLLALGQQLGEGAGVRRPVCCQDAPILLASSKPGTGVTPTVGSVRSGDFLHVGESEEAAVIHWLPLDELARPWRCDLMIAIDQDRAMIGLVFLQALRARVIEHHVTRANLSGVFEQVDLRIVMDGLRPVGQVNIHHRIADADEPRAIDLRPLPAFRTLWVHLAEDVLHADVADGLLEHLGATLLDSPPDSDRRPLGVGPADREAETSVVLLQELADALKGLLLGAAAAELLVRTADPLRSRDLIQAPTENLERLLELFELVAIL